MGDDAEKKNYCKICFETTSKYMCPQCGIPYCSIKCYRDVEKHLKCSEAFYRRCVQEELQSQSVEDSTEENTKKMKEILQRYHNNIDTPSMQDLLNPDLQQEEQEDDVQEEDDDDDEELDSDDDEPLDKRLGDIDLDDSEKVWDKLTAEEREDFMKMVRTNEGVEPVAEPWYPGRKLIQECSTSKTQDEPD